MVNQRNKTSKPVSKPNKKINSAPLNISYTNIRGFRTNYSHIQSFLANSSPDILAISETNLGPNINTKTDFLNSGYLPLVRKDSETHMHGLGVYLRDSLPITRVSELEDINLPYMCFRLSLLHSTSYLYFLYRSPSSQDCSVIQSVSDSIDKALNLHHTANIFVFGDFNAHHQGWLKFSNGISASGVDIYNFAVSQSLHQIIDFPTRFPDREDQSPSLLDLFLTSNPDICKASGEAPLGNSDHGVVSVLASLNCKASQESPFHRTLFSYERGDWDSFRDFLRDVPWTDVFAHPAEKCAEEITSWLSSGISAFIPSRKFQVKPHSSPWFSPACAAAIAHRNHFFHQYQRDQSTANKDLFSEARNHCKSVIREAKLSYQNQIHNHIASQKIGSRNFWRIIKSVRSSKKSVIPPLFNGPEVLTSSKDKAELFANLFSANSTLDDTDHPVPEFLLRTDKFIENFDITPAKISSIIATLDISKATGPDGIPAILFQKCSPELSSVLSRLYNKCLSEGCFPSSWKFASVIPVFKNCGEQSNPKNYRPISLLPIISKIFEALINDKIVYHLESNNLFSDSQYGFRSSRSTADLLTVITDRIYSALNKSGEARAVALDISKAFDKVWHAGLLKKLVAYGIKGPLLQIIRSFLSNRKLKVVLDGQSSSSFSINAGVPQGSVLGPTLFLIFINDLPDDLISKLAIYADDSTIYSCIPKSDMFSQVEMAGEIELDLMSIVEWGEKWMVTFNSTKTKLLSVNHAKNPFLPSISMNGTDLEESDCFRLLGITFSRDFSWRPYIEAIAKSASMKVGSLLRARNYLTPESILYLYKSTIRPCIEYCCHIWGGASSESLNLLDRIQRRVCNSIGESLSSKLDSLSHRRAVSSLCLFYKYFHGHCSSELSDLVPPIKAFSRTTRYSSNCHPFTVIRNESRKSFFQNSFFPRTSSLWNSLPLSVFPPNYNLQNFKCNVHRYLSS